MNRPWASRSFARAASQPDHVTRFTMLRCGLLLFAASLPGVLAGQEAKPIPSPQSKVWELQNSGVDASLRGLCVVDENVVWASGTKGTVLRTTDGGAHWMQITVPGAQKLDFRDIHAFDDQVCVVVNAGTPGIVFRTEDGGKTWHEAYRNEAKTIFFDALSFWDLQRGIAFSDPQDGKLFLIETVDGGRSWTPFATERQPEMHPGEAAFAASGTCMAVMDEQSVWIATGGEHGPNNEASARVLLSEDAGKSWFAATTPIASDKSSGIFSLAFANANHGVAVGGNYEKPQDHSSNVAITDDSGRNWRAITGRHPGGYRSAVAVLNLNFETYFVAVGPTGSDVSRDWGNSWQTIDDGSFNSVAFTSNGKAGWAVGGDGRIAKWIGNAVVLANSEGSNDNDQ